MKEIVVLQKPDTISYEEIHNLIYLAHKDNRNNGFHVQTAEMNADELEKHIGDEGQCFVALDTNKLIGITAVRVVARNNRYAKGRIADQILVAVHPDYTGKHISTKLHNAVEKYCIENGLTQIELRTAADNRKMQAACIKWGFNYLDFKAFSGIDHYTVVMMKWLKNKPSLLMVGVHYFMRKAYIKARYKPGKIKRVF